MQDNISITEKTINENLYTICNTLDMSLSLELIFLQEIIHKAVTTESLTGVASTTNRK